MPTTPEGGGASQSTEIAAGTSSGTDVPLKELVQTLHGGVKRQMEDNYARLEDKIAASERLLFARLESLASDGAMRHDSAQTAITKAEEAIQRRLDLLNEFRGQISEDAQKYAQREVVDAQIQELRRAISDLTDKVGKL
jgi:Skp family chaperone for outer membrane proteins